MSPALYSRLRRETFTLLLAAALTAVCALVLSDSEQLALAGMLPAAPAVAALAPAPTELTPGTAMDGFGSYSPDGRQTVFMRDGQIWLMPVGGKARQLSGSDKAWDAAPAWRPDGKQIAFVRHPLGGGGSAIMVVDPGSGRVRQLLASQTQIAHLAYAPDGKSLYFTTAQHLMRTGLTGKPTAEEVYALPDDWDMLPGGLAIAPDGKSAIFGAGSRNSRSVQYDLWQLPLLDPSNHPRQLTQTGGIMPALDRTGQWVAFRNPRSDTGIYLMNLATRQARQVVADSSEAMYFHPSFSPDGRSLILSRLNLKVSQDAQGNSRFTSALGIYPLPAAGPAE